MQLSTQYVGEHSEPYECEIASRATMNFAASVGDANPLYFDDERPDGLVVPPLYAVSATWALSVDFPKYWGRSGFPMEVLQQQVHYSEVLEWHRPMRVGERLRIEGTCAAILPHPGGTHLIICYTAFGSDGAMVFREYIGGILRDVECVGEAKQMPDLPTIPRVALSRSIEWEQQLHIDPLAAHVYDACADLHFPIHTSVAFAHAVGLPGTIYHGTATLALAIREILARETVVDPLRMRRLCCNFTGMVPLDSDITIQVGARHVADGVERVPFQVLNASGQKAIRNGSLELSGSL